MKEKHTVKPIEKCTVGIAGLGLMGGAFALALRQGLSGQTSGPEKQAGPERIFAYDRDEGVLKTALGRGVVDEMFTEPKAMLGHCDFVILCLNPSALVDFIETYGAFFKSGALVTDIAGIKGSVCAAAERLLRSREDLDFIPGHPMAGSEKKGMVNAGMVNFTGKNYILTPLKRNKPENLVFLKSLIHRMGFGRITETSAADHDDKIAFTSQLCHVIAASLIDCEPDTEITRYGGGSFEDLTRIAMLNAPMWAEIFLENSERLLGRIVRFEQSLDEIKALIAAGRGPELEARLAAVRDRRQAMG
ncbi:MAG: prephenate dehydrogenase [Treponema sp.]|jgi:prephenate dehydrogenase|nr:prephenate dehydrogenase [Treponema sp.]